MTDRVETPKQLATRLENVSERQIRNLIKSGELESVQIGGRIYVPADAWSLLVERKRKRTWPDETKAHDSNGTVVAVVGTSAGTKLAATSSAALARRTAKRLKSSSQNGCRPDSGNTAQVIPLKPS
jgi:hypothetical protein